MSREITCLSLKLSGLVRLMEHPLDKYCPLFRDIYLTIVRSRSAFLYNAFMICKPGKLTARYCPVTMSSTALRT